MQVSFNNNTIKASFLGGEIKVLVFCLKQLNKATQWLNDNKGILSLYCQKVNSKTNYTLEFDEDTFYEMKSAVSVSTEPESIKHYHYVWHSLYIKFSYIQQRMILEKWDSLSKLNYRKF